MIPKPLNAGKMATGSSYLIIIILHKMSRKSRELQWDLRARWVENVPALLSPAHGAVHESLRIQCGGCGMRGRRMREVRCLSDGSGWRRARQTTRTHTGTRAASPPQTTTAPRTLTAARPGEHESWKSMHWWRQRSIIYRLLLFIYRLIEASWSHVSAMLRSSCCTWGCIISDLGKILRFCVSDWKKQAIVLQICCLYVHLSICHISNHSS